MDLLYTMELWDLKAEIKPFRLGPGRSYPALWFECPVCPVPHLHMIPFHGKPVEDVPGARLYHAKYATSLSLIKLEPAYEAICMKAVIDGGQIEIYKR